MGECFFWYRPIRVVLDQRPLNGRCCRCIEILSPLGKSDHAILNIKCQSVLHREDNSTSKFNYGKGDYEKLRNSLDIDWVHVFNSFGNDVDKIWDYFKNELLLNVQNIYLLPVTSDS